MPALPQPTRSDPPSTATRTTVAAILGGSVIIGMSIVAAAWLKTAVGPKPPRPPGPATTLSDAFPDATSRRMVGVFYRDLAAAVEAAPLKTTGQFRESQRTAAQVLRTTAQLPDSPLANPIISQRIADAIGLDDSPLDPARKAALIQALVQIANELNSGI